MVRSTNAKTGLRFAVALAFGFALAVLSDAGSARADEAPTVSVLTMGPGDPTFSKFGHDAIVVSPAGDRSHVYNFGTFSFQSKRLFRDFLSGRLRYWLSLASLPRTLDSYRRQNRSLLVQELHLDRASASALAEALEENSRPENRYYLYDHFRDNCSTRVRDAIDRATGGRVRRALDRPAGATYREHALRLVADDWLLYVGLDLGLGPAVDGRITEWDEGFLPERLALSLRRVRVPGPNGEVPLVARETTVFEAKREPARERAPVRAPWFFVVGVLLGGSLGALFRGSSRRARVAAGVLSAALGVVSGLLGALLLFLWVATNNDVAHRNANAFLSPVVALALVPAGIAFAMGRSSGRKLAERTLLACVALAVVGVVFALAVGHDVRRTAALFVPLWALGFAGLRVRKTKRAA
ncbi:MAG TPA: DUF4105 domain-containing protein [Polyangiaceae bacterium]